MAIKTFTTGEVLTASDTNTYLANAGLVYVTSTTVGSGVSTVTVSSCFSSSFDNYRIVYFGGTSSTQQELRLQMGSTTTGYYNTLLYGAYSATPSALAAGLVNTANFGYAGVGDPDGCSLTVDVMNPNLAKRTVIAGSFIGMDTDRVFGTTGGFLADTTAYTSFTMTPSTGTITGGTITVYGYRKA